MSRHAFFFAKYFAKPTHLPLTNLAQYFIIYLCFRISPGFFGNHEYRFFSRELAVVFSSLIFLFAYLIITLAVYYVVPRKWRNVVLFVLSLLFYGWGEPVYILLMIASITVAYVGGFFIEKYRHTSPKKCKAAMIASLAINLSFLLFFKYFNFTMETLSLIPFLSGIAKPIEGLSLPVGISFYTFQIMSYSIDLYRHETEVQKNYIAFGTYVTLFPQLIAGPIVRYRDVDDQLMHRRENLADFSAGVRRFCAGLAKKVLLGDGAAAAFRYFSAAAGFEHTALGAWMTVICYTLHIYYDFSGYSDMAIGLGKMFGFHFVENFDYPYISRSITEFWRRWHITLSTWFREYVYIPLGGNRKGKARQYLNLAVVWLLTGLWHGASWNFVLWGLYYFVFLLIEKFLFRISKEPSKGILRILRTAYTLVVVLFGWMLFYYTDLSELLTAFKGLFTLNRNVITNLTVQTTFTGNMIFLAVAILACTPIIPTIGRAFERLREKKQTNGISRTCIVAYDLVTALIPVGLVFLSLLCLVGDSYNPFLYFQF